MSIKQEVIEFINSEENNGAFLLTGKWGCGKTYIIKDVIKELNCEGKYAIALISLFGISDIETLNYRIKDEYLEFQSELFGKKAKKIYEVISKVAKESAAITAAALPEKAAASAVSVGVNSVTSFDILNFVSVKSTVKRGDKKEKFILVFDDFERCDIPQIQLMGVINEYSENREIKTIIIADEDKIINDKKKKYSDFKEKLISRTIRITPENKNTIHTIIESYKCKDGEYKEFLLKKEPILLAAYEQSEYNNLRSFKSCIMDFERVYYSWKQSDVSMHDLDNVLYKFCATTYECKAGRYIEINELGFLTYIISSNKENETENEYEKKSIARKYLPDTFQSFFMSLSDWIVNGNWDEQAFVDEIRSKYTICERTTHERFLGLNFWDLDQTDIDEGMPVAIEYANNGYLTRDEYISLLQKIHGLKSHDISLPCEVDYSKIKNGFDVRKNKIKNGTIDEPKRMSFSEKHQLDEEAFEIYDDIELCDRLLIGWENRRKFIDCLKNRNISETYELRNKFLDCFDCEIFKLFVSAYNDVSNADKRQLCWAITGFEYNKSFKNSDENVKQTIDNFKELKVFLNEHMNRTNDQISKAIDVSFCDQIDEKVQEIQE